METPIVVMARSCACCLSSRRSWMADGHAAIELPPHLSALQFDELARECWKKGDWGGPRIEIKDNADRGWIEYMLKPWQKSGLEDWSDCIDWESLHNPIADT